MLQGFLIALIAGSLVSLQTIFNSKVNGQAGSWVTTTLVLGLGFAASLTLGLILEGRAMFSLEHAKAWFFFSGLIGVGVVTCLMQGIRRLGPTYAVSLSLASQLVCALVLDSQGWLGLTKVDLTPGRLIGVLVIVAGMLVFKLGGRRAGTGKEADGPKAEAKTAAKAGLPAGVAGSNGEAV
ncbi:DMT family transporter [Paenibacillus sacheonensis]|uniref:EamA-like transporter family protein n=1 Tax=Paenibacillus sacheonensis TaxID=742054 RepID=A0A7X4YJL0_9BACL|nr:DMT family transporter [Paenibacillus sacheonensis]MBM7564145.1 transporter family-2 protein [Paenibacillus sacheonensis]NBC67525.1 EamA-like transporter family protein [Paenibacillus sacheonensis]